MKKINQFMLNLFPDGFLLSYKPGTIIVLLNFVCLVGTYRNGGSDTVAFLNIASLTLGLRTLHTVYKYKREIKSEADRFHRAFQLAIELSGPRIDAVFQRAHKEHAIPQDGTLSVEQLEGLHVEIEAIVNEEYNRQLGRSKKPF